MNENEGRWKNSSNFLTWMDSMPVIGWASWHHHGQCASSPHHSEDSETGDKLIKLQIIVNQYGATSIINVFNIFF